MWEASERGIKPYYSLECRVNSRIHSLGSLNASVWIFIKDSERTRLKRNENISQRVIVYLSEDVSFSPFDPEWNFFSVYVAVSCCPQSKSERISDGELVRGSKGHPRERETVWRDMKALCQVTFPPRHYNTLKLHVNARSHSRKSFLWFTSLHSTNLNINLVFWLATLTELVPPSRCGQPVDVNKNFYLPKWFWTCRNLQKKKSLPT